MDTTLLTAGIACIIAGIVGGGLKAFGIELPIFKSIKRQIVLGVFGVLLCVASQLIGAGSTDKKPGVTKPDEVIVRYRHERTSAGPTLSVVREGHYWHVMDVLIENQTTDTIDVSLPRFTLFLAKHAFVEGAQGFYPATSDADKQEKLLTREWLKPGETVTGMIPYWVPFHLTNGLEAASCIHMIRYNPGGNKMVKHEPY